MKKIRKTVILLTVTAVLMSACSNMADGSIDSGEIVVPEMSSEELLVSSLEFLLQDDENTAEEPEESLAEEINREEEETSGVEEDRDDKVETQDTEDVQAERVPNENEAVIYYGNAGSYELNQEIIQIEEKTAEELLDALSRHNIVSLDTKVLSFEEKEESGEKMLYLNLSRAVSEYLKTMSKEAECVILASIVNTFLENYDADGVNIAVDEKPLTTKNAEYAGILRKCTPGELLEMIAAPEEKAEEEEMQEQRPETNKNETIEPETKESETIEPEAEQTETEDTTGGMETQPGEGEEAYGQDQ